MIEAARIAGHVDQDQMIVRLVKLVPLKPVPVIDKRPVATQFLDKDPVTQALRRQKVGLALGQPDLKL